MKRARGKRPLAICLFGALFTTQALLAFLHAVGRLGEMQVALSASLPLLAIDRDLTIVAICARLTIALIPVAMVWFFASRPARWLVLAMVLVRLLLVPAHAERLLAGEALSLLWLGSLLLALLGAALLFTRDAARWFACGGRRSG